MSRAEVVFCLIFFGRYQDCSSYDAQFVCCRIFHTRDNVFLLTTLPWALHVVLCHFDLNSGNLWGAFFMRNETNSYVLPALNHRDQPIFQRWSLAWSLDSGSTTWGNTKMKIRNGIVGLSVLISPSVNCARKLCFAFRSWWHASASLTSVRI